MADYLLWLAAIAALIGVAILRWSWARARRSALLNLAGWAGLAGAAAAGSAAAGAWGVAVAAMAAMGGAMLLLAAAAATAPRKRTRSAKRRARILPDPGEPLGLAGRALTFAEVVIGGLAASLALATALRVAAILSGGDEANANAAALFAAPLAWGILACAVLMMENRRSRWITLGLAAAPLMPALLLGS